MPLILDGKKARDFYKAKLAERVAVLSVVPRLAIIQVGENRESSIYIEQKKKFGKSVGADVIHVKFPADVSEETVRKELERLNADETVHGIIIQLPLPENLDRLALINLISPGKDVDGLTDENQKLLEEGRPRFVPATAKGVGLLLEFYHIGVRGKNIAVLGRSRLVGHPIAELMKMKGAAVTVCHSKTPEPERITEKSDIIIVAIGKPELVDIAYIGSEGTIVVDVGINSVEGKSLEEEIPKRKVVGDVDFDDVEPYVSAISPVPGGVGPMTVLSLFDNLIVSAEKMTGRNP